MKKLRLLTVSTMLLAGSLATFTSCGGGEDSEENESKKENGYALVKQTIDAIENGDLEMNVSDADDVKKVMDIDSDDDDYILIEETFKGYDFDIEFTIEDGVLYDITCNSFYDKNKKKEAKKDAEEILDYMIETLGEPDDVYEDMYDWNYDDYMISFNIWEDGYSMYVELPYDDYDYDDYDYDDEESCVGDFYGLKTDLKDYFLVNIKNGSIVMGETTQDEMESLTGDADGFDAEYNGLSVLGSYEYEGGVITSINLDYFYDCEGALEFLDMDTESITDLINTELGVNSQDGTWSINGLTVEQMNFDDGYGVYFE